MRPIVIPVRWSARLSVCLSYHHGFLLYSEHTIDDSMIKTITDERNFIIRLLYKDIVGLLTVGFIPFTVI